MSEQNSNEVSENMKKLVETLTTEESKALMFALIPHLANATREMLLRDHFFLSTISESVMRATESAGKIKKHFDNDEHWVELTNGRTVANWWWTVRFVSIEELRADPERDKEFDLVPFLEKVPEPTMDTISDHYTLFTREGIPVKRTKGGDLEHVFRKADELILRSAIAGDIQYYEARTLVVRLPDDNLEARQQQAEMAYRAREEIALRQAEALEKAIDAPVDVTH